MEPASSWPIVWVLLAILGFLVYCAIHVAVAVWMYRDGKRRQNPNINWWLFAFVVAGFFGFTLIVLLLYAFARARYSAPGETRGAGPRTGAVDYVTEGKTVRVRAERVSRDAVLLMMTGPDSGQRMELNVPATTIGRGSENDIWLRRDEEASARHCRISQDGSLYALEDLNSTNGTTVVRSGDVAQVAPGHKFRLADADVIRLGQTEIKFLRLRA